MGIEDDVSKDLPLDEDEAAGVTGGAAELGDGAAGENAVRGVKKARTSHAADAKTTLAPDRYQVLRNDEI